MNLLNKKALLALDWSCAIGVAGLFAYAAIPKILAPAAFAGILSHYNLVPSIAVTPIALFLPWLELVCAIGLIVSPHSRVEIYGLLGTLLIAFTVATALNLLRGIAAPCGCFGSEATDSPATWWHVLRNLGFLVGICAATWIRTLHATAFR